MPTFSRTDVPFLLNGSAKIDVDVSLINPNKPFERDGPMLETSFAAAGQQTVSLGQASTVKIGVTSSATAGLAAYFPGTTGAALKTLKSISAVLATSMSTANSARSRSSQTCSTRWT